MNNLKLYVRKIYDANTSLGETELEFISAADLGPIIVKRNFDVNNPNSKVGDYTLNLSLPTTDKNNVFFNYLNDVNNARSFFYQQRYPARIEANSETLIEGNLYVLSVTPDTYECTIVGANIGWADLLSNKQLTETGLDPVLYTGIIGSRFNQYGYKNIFVGGSVAFTNIIGTFEKREPLIPTPIGPEFKDNYQFYLPFIQYGNFYDNNYFEVNGSSDAINQTITIFFNYSYIQPYLFNGILVQSDVVENGSYVRTRNILLDGSIEITLFNSSYNSPITSTSNNIKFTFFIEHPKDRGGYIGDVGSPDLTNYITNTPENNLSWKDFYFAPYVKSIIKAIFKDIGYNCSGTFINDTITDDLIIPFAKESETYKYIDSNNNETTDGIWGNALAQQLIRYDFATPNQFITYTNTNSILEYYNNVRFIKNFSNSTDTGIYYYVVPSGNKDIIINKKVNTEGIILPTYAAEGFPTFYYSKFRVFKKTTTKLTLSIFNYTNQSSLLYFQNLEFILFLYKTKEEIIDGKFTNFDIEDYFINGTPIVINDNLIAYREFNAPNGIPQVITNAQNFNDVEIEMDIDDNLYLLMAVKGRNVTNIPFFDDNNIVLNISAINIDWEPGYTNSSYNDTLYTYPQHFLPDDFTQLQFIQEIIRLFNLQVEFDINQKLINFNYYKDNLFNGDFAIDWSDKCNILEANIRPIDVAKEYLFNYTNDESYYFSPENKFNYRRLSDSKYFSNIQTIENKFSPTGNREINFYLNGYTLKIPSIGKFDDYKTPMKDSQASNTSANIRILQSIGLTTLTDYTLVTNSNTLQVPFNTSPLRIDNTSIEYNGEIAFPLAYFDFNDIKPTRGKLNSVKINPFTNQVEDVVNFDFSDPVDGLYKKYWSQNIEFLEKTHLIDLPVYLTIEDITRLNTRVPVKIKDQIFYIVSIDGFNPATEAPVKVTLIKKL